MCSLTFTVDELSGLPLHPLILSVIRARSGSIINGTLSDFWYWLNVNTLVS